MIVRDESHMQQGSCSGVTSFVSRLVGLSKLLLLICCMSCLTTTHSTSFDMKHSPDTG